MTYRLNPEVEKIKSPIILQIPGEKRTLRFTDGPELASALFETNYLIESLTAQDDAVLLVIRRNDKVNDTSWFVGSQSSLSFF